MTAEKTVEKMPPEEITGRDLAKEGSKVHCSGGVSSCGCSRCALYRWYPPLLIVSTLLAGLFCTLYLTKPVHVVSPLDGIEEVKPQAFPVREEPAPDEGGESGVDMEHLVGSPDLELNPLQLGLPGETKDQWSEAESVLPLFSDSGRGEPEFQPLVVDKPRRNLFVPSASTAPLEKEGVLTNEVAAKVNAELVEAEAESIGGLGVEIPDTRGSELVTAVTDRSESSSLLYREDSMGSASSGQLLGGFMMAEPGTGEGADVERPYASIIGEFYEAEPIASEVNTRGTEIYH